MRTAVILLIGIALLTACATTHTTKEDEMTLSNKEKVVALLNSLESGDPGPAGYINPEKYVQHNLAIGDGLAGFGEFLKQVPQGSIKVNIVRSFSDGEYVFTHTDYDFFGPKVGFDIFRFEDGKIVEHWDNMAEKAAQPNPSGHTQLDGPTEAADLDNTSANKAVAKDFVETILMAGQYDKLGSYFDGDTYVQHNTAIPDGVSGLTKAVAAMAEQGITMVYDKIHMVLGEGNFTLVVSEGKFGGKHVAFYDLFRVEGGKIAEHWDVVQEIPAQSEWKNSNGKF